MDRERSPGRYILTGSANLLLMKSVSESLAGRAAYLSLWPMTRRERLGQGRTGLWSELLDHPCEDWPEVLGTADPKSADWREAASQGGFYWRTATGEEVDLVVERGADLLAIEVKAPPGRRPATPSTSERSGTSTGIRSEVAWSSTGGIRWSGWVPGSWRLRGGA